MAVPAPFRLDEPSFLIGAADPPTTEMKCHGRRFNITADQSFEDIETFCNPGGEAPGITKRSINVEVFQSFAAEGLWNVLYPLEGDLVYFSFSPDGTTTGSATNPIMEGQCYVPAIPFVDAGVKKFSPFSIEFRIYGIPTYDIGS